LPRHGGKLQVFLRKLKSAKPVLPRIVKNAANSKIFEHLGYLRDEEVKIGNSDGQTGLNSMKIDGDYHE
jgi:hypothetical protein